VHGDGGIGVVYLVPVPTSAMERCDLSCGRASQMAGWIR